MHIGKGGGVRTAFERVVQKAYSFSAFCGRVIETASHDRAWVSASLAKSNAVDAFARSPHDIQAYMPRK